MKKSNEIDALVADKEKMIELLQKKLQAIITELVKKGLNPKIVLVIGELYRKLRISSFVSYLNKLYKKLTEYLYTLKNLKDCSH